MIRPIIGNKAAAIYLGCNPRTIWMLRKEGKFPQPQHQCGRMAVWSAMQLDAVKLQMRKPGNPNFCKIGTQISASVDNSKPCFEAKP